MMIDTNEKLAALCARLERSPFVAVDTEFIRERTYWPELCLIQIADENEAACVDPLAPELDLTPLLALMKNPRVLKVFHAGRQDIEIFYHLMQAVPSPVFDTQIGAMVLGLGESVSYQTLVHAFLNIELDKSARFTDWSHRPLTKKQVTYALSDVTHLVPIYREMTQRLAQRDRTSWVQNEMDHLIDPVLYDVDPMNVYQRIKRTTDQPLFVALLQALCAWRERLAQTLNRPRRLILKDEALLELAASRPQTLEDLTQMRQMPAGVVKKHGSEILSVIAAVLASPSDTWPRVTKPKPLTAAQKNVKEMLRLLLTVVCEQAGVAPKVVASSEDLDALARSDNPDIPAMKGFRYELFGRPATAFKAGRLALFFDPAAHKMVFLDRKKV